MTDHLATIAAKTVECGCVTEDMTQVCIACKGSCHVLDPRFDRLREIHDRRTHGIGWGGHYTRCSDDCPGYTVVRDLAVLLEIMLPQGSVFFQEEHGVYTVRFHLWRTRGVGVNGKGDTPLEACTNAAWEGVLGARV